MYGLMWKDGNMIKITQNHTPIEYTKKRKWKIKRRKRAENNTIRKVKIKEVDLVLSMQQDPMCCCCKKKKHKRDHNVVASLYTLSRPHAPLFVHPSSDTVTVTTHTFTSPPTFLFPSYHVSTSSIKSLNFIHIFNFVKNVFV